MSVETKILDTRYDTSASSVVNKTCDAPSGNAYTTVSCPPSFVFCEKSRYLSGLICFISGITLNFVK